MINPEDSIPMDDEQNSEADDQQSQKDIHSNGFDDVAPAEDGDNSADADRLEQASRASESAYTLNLDDAPATDE